MARLSGKTAVITGGNSGIGLQTARAFVAEGAQVVIFGRNQKTLDDAAKQIGGGVVAVQGDVTRQADLDRLFATAKETFGGIDVLFVNAGIAKPSAIGETTEEFFDETFSVNVKGAYFTIQTALPLLRKGASVILTSSSADSLGIAGLAVYSATKAAIRSLARTLSAELGPKGIRVNSVAPGPIETPIFGRMGLPKEAVEQMGQQILAKVPQGRFGKPEEVAAPVVFLASDESSYMLGAQLSVDGGQAQM